jgi:hypothetical protein
VAACRHPDPADGRCRVCGACLHEVILNRVCMTCGEVDPPVTNKPAAETVVPVDRLRRPPGG